MPAFDVDSRDFYELCQQYRLSQEWYPHGMTPTETFEDLKRYIKTGKLPWPSYEVMPHIDEVSPPED